MNTPTHFLLTAAVQKSLPGWRMDRSAVLCGSLAPDIPLYLLSIGSLWYFHRVRGWQLEQTAQHMFTNLYFHDPAWIALHSVLHSPLSIMILWGLVELWRRWSPNRGQRLRWFLLACLFHAVVDIFTHHDDGPLLLWPFDWQLRFHSPISYWDHRHFGSQVARLELALDVALAVYLAGPWLWRRIAGRRAPHGRTSQSELRP